MSDLVSKPQHYTQGDIECIDAIKSALSREPYIGFLHGNALKYVWRCRLKENPIQDIDKAIWYLEKMKKESGNEIQ